jgi:peptidoglycan/LPS O-acetylase OafA/YrhL
MLESEGGYRGVARRLFFLPIMVWMGEVSYAAYLIHQHSRTIVDHNDALYRPWILVTYIPLVAAVSWILHVYIEEPAHKWLIQEGNKRGWCCDEALPASAV